FVCQQCGHQAPKWQGQCPGCGEWNSLEETSLTISAGSKASSAKAKVLTFSQIESYEKARVKSNINELDRVLGGGIVPGSVVLLAGEPGIGKSTLLLQLSDSFANRSICYVCGEESPEQVKMRADRLGAKGEGLKLISAVDVDEIIIALSDFKKDNLVIIDSIQTLTTQDLTGTAGSIGQVRESASRLINFAKKNNMSMFLVGHVTKSGAIAGPKILEHAVDTVIYFEGDQYGQLRLLRSVKNRFGATGEVGVFMMTSSGLEPVDNPSKLFLSANQKPIAGVVKTVLLKGTRPLILEVQSLVTQTNMAYPRRLAKGMSRNKLELHVAVLQKHLKAPLFNQDVILNVAGGIKSEEPAIDLASCLAIWSSYNNKAIDPEAVVFGEIGLLGEIRPTSQEERRVAEAKRLGYKKIISSQNASSLLKAIKMLTGSK
ncbi:MAG: DNA repair protein RadA, partial [Candidatus Shapirobacteria bacterium]|nr:DNA repair protein RadA [Candidatus Shapirobacteria bacterium]